MWWTGREAAAELAQHGISEWRGREALRCGLAGTPVRTRSAHLYDSERVLALGRRRVVEPGEMRELAPRGYYVSRRAVQVDVAPDELLERLSERPRGLDGWAALLLAVSCGLLEGMPFVATVAGFVVAGADLHGIRGERLVLRPPGEWFEQVKETQLPTGRGRAWTVQEPWMSEWRSA